MTLLAIALATSIIGRGQKRDRSDKRESERRRGGIGIADARDRCPAENYKTSAKYRAGRSGEKPSRESRGRKADCTEQKITV